MRREQREKPGWRRALECSRPPASLLPAGTAVHIPGEASSWCCLESSSLEIHSVLTVAVGSLEFSFTSCLIVKTPTHTGYSLPRGLFTPTGVSRANTGSQVKRVHGFKGRWKTRRYREMGGRLAGTDGPYSKINALNLLKEIREDNSNMKLQQEIIINEPSRNVRHEKRKRLD